VKNDYIKRAEKYLGADWATPKASVFLDFVRNGNRSRYQSVRGGRRNQLQALVLAECMEGKGRFLDDIMNGVWTICEETYWGVPAHVSAQKRGAGLPDVTEPTVDLFAAETGMMLAWIEYLLGDQLDKASPLVGERIRFEIRRRILDVCLEREDFWWMGYSGRVVNNWNPWICSNWLTAVLLLEEDIGRRIASVAKILQCLDHFLNHYPEDGGCDEGPSYWGRAAASLFDCLELLYWSTNGRITLFKHPLIKAMGGYIYKVYIHDDYFINFADAAARMTPDPSLVYRFGSAVEDDHMERFGGLLAKRKEYGNQSIGVNLGRVLPALFALDPLKAAKPKEPLIRDFWLPALEVMGSRSKNGSVAGFYMAAKGGHNDESHNHNDVGNFIVYADGYPALIDVGVETYTRKTFSSKRYEIWTMQSAYHNLPEINGRMQSPGRKFQARDVQYHSDRNQAVFNLDIAGAYPEEAAVKTYKRSLIMNRGNSVVMKDNFELVEASVPLKLSLMSWRKPEIVSNGIIRLENPPELKNKKPLIIRYPGKAYHADIERITLEDGRLKASWGGHVYRIVLSEESKTAKGEVVITVEYGR